MVVVMVRWVAGADMAITVAEEALKQGLRVGLCQAPERDQEQKQRLPQSTMLSRLLQSNLAALFCAAAC